MENIALFPVVVVAVSIIGIVIASIIGANKVDLDENKIESL